MCLKIVNNHKKVDKVSRERAFKLCYLEYTKSFLNYSFSHPILSVDIKSGNILVDRLDELF